MKLSDRRSSAVIESTASCTLCGHGGKWIYKNLKDHLFRSPALGSYCKCVNPDCALIWLEPMPEASDVARAYDNYYTHVASASVTTESFLKRAYLVVKRGYLASQFGYHYATQSTALNLLGSLLFLFPIRRAEVDSEVRHLPAQKGGQLLDVGCGAGDWLIAMQDFKWRVKGVDFDSRAVAVASSRGLEVDCGSLEEQCYPDASYDAITLNHVIEHLPNPLGTLRECYRILKPDGRLMLYTPNSESLGHLIFGRHWRGLESPRHLFLFRPDAMREILSQAGFKHVIIHTTNSQYMWRQSLGLWRGSIDLSPEFSPSLKAQARLLTLIEQAMLAVKPGMGECLAVTGIKM